STDLYCALPRCGAERHLADAMSVGGERTDLDATHDDVERMVGGEPAPAHREGACRCGPQREHGASLGARRAASRRPRGFHDIRVVCSSSREQERRGAPDERCSEVPGYLIESHVQSSGVVRTPASEYGCA